MEAADKKDVIAKLQQQILSMQGCRSALEDNASFNGLAQLEQAFPNKVFPLGAVHEMISYSQEERAATSGFISALVSRINYKAGLCLWVANHRSVFPPALQLFGVPPDRVLFVNVCSSKQALWVTEEALKCPGLSIVIAELPELSFTQSRRLQLAVEQSQVTGFIHRYQPRIENTVACVSRWRIRPMPSLALDGLPGPGRCRWKVELLKVRNGKPGVWQIEWTDQGMREMKPANVLSPVMKTKTG